jgi:peptide/nickel transport system ATP-binding protein
VSGVGLRVEGLTIRASSAGASAPLVDDVSFVLPPGESLAIVGESGSGKTLLGRSLLGLLPPGVSRTSGAIWLGEHGDLTRKRPRELRAIRGREIGMVFQEPMVSLNPSLKVGLQITEALMLHRKLTRPQARERAVAMLERVRIQDPAKCLDRYPHAFSGGMRQRLMLASVMLLEPRLLIADEPTTALDCIVQREVLDLMRELVMESGSSLLFISHDLALVSVYCDAVAVMSKGRIVESGAAREVLSNPRHEYTRALLDALPRRGISSPVTSAEPPSLEVRELVVDYPGERTGWFSARVPARAVDAVSFEVKRGETLGIVGESGSGKTTVARSLLGLAPFTAGTLRLDGEVVSPASPEGLRLLRKHVQIIFQDPYSSLDPRMKVSELVAEGIAGLEPQPAAQLHAEVLRYLEEVGLPGAFADRYPHELSGGQRQRIAIARALIMKPRVLVADEAVSALDVTIQSQILALMKRLQRSHGFSLVFISHDLGVIEQICDRVVVMYRGKVVEEGVLEQLFDAPRHPYTANLLQALPELAREKDAQGRTRYIPRMRSLPSPQR